MRVLQRVLFAPGIDLREPLAAAFVQLADVRGHRLESVLGVGDELDLRPHVLAHLGAVDVDVDEGLDLRGEVGEARGDAVVDAHADHHQNVGVLDRLQVPTRAHESGHVQGERVVDGERSNAEKGRADRRAGLLGELEQLGLRRG